jgi:hypothetical protein
MFVCRQIEKATFYWLKHTAITRIILSDDGDIWIKDVTKTKLPDWEDTLVGL